MRRALSGMHKSCNLHGMQLWAKIPSRCVARGGKPFKLVYPAQIGEGSPVPVLVALERAPSDFFIAPILRLSLRVHQ
jgi:hypothetical protein